MHWNNSHMHYFIAITYMIYASFLLFVVSKFYMRASICMVWTILGICLTDVPYVVILVEQNVRRSLCCMHIFFRSQARGRWFLYATDYEIFQFGNLSSLMGLKRYAESLFGFCSFAGLWHFVMGAKWQAILFFGLSSGIRSNGLLHAGFFLFQAMHCSYKAAICQGRPLVKHQHFLHGLLVETWLLCKKVKACCLVDVLVGLCSMHYIHFDVCLSLSYARTKSHFQKLQGT